MTHWPNNAIVGYIDGTAIGAVSSISKEQIESYDILIFGFTDGQGLIPNIVHDSINKVRSLTNKKLLQFISFGGGGNDNLQLTDKTIDNLIDTAKKYQFDGIDLDIEQGTLSINKLETFITDLKEKINKQFLFTIAPILAGEPNLPSLNIPSGGSLKSIYSKISFDAILVQAYNSGISFSYPLPNDPSQLVNEESPNIVAAAYHALQQHGDIHTDSKIVIGVPANTGAAPTASNCWNNRNIQETADTLVNNFQQIIKEENSINAKQYGGLMTWSLTCDAAPQSYETYQGNLKAPVGYFVTQVAKPVKQLS